MMNIGRFSRHAGHVGIMIRSRLVGVVFVFLCSNASAQVENMSSKRLSDLESLLAEAAALSVHEQLRRVNRFFNAYEQNTDLEIWGANDYWSTPAELLQRGRGDCEDIAIAKYFTLVALGVPESRLRLLITRNFNGGNRRIEGHMVLVYRADDGTDHVLDNTDRVLRQLSARPDLVPRFAFNRSGQWSVRANRDRRLELTRHIRSWRDMLARIDPGTPAGL
jgi:predicted transglutaminase-like cysteine proteinase